MSLSKRIFNTKLHFRENAQSKVKSLENIDHQPKSSDIQIYSEQLPWLRYNKPNLPEEVKEQINKKQYSLEQSSLYSSPNYRDSELETPMKNKKLHVPTMNDDNGDGNVSPKISFPRIESHGKSEIKDRDEANSKLKINSKESSLQKRENNFAKEHEDSRNSKTKPNNKNLAKIKSPPQKVDAATETDQPTLVSIDVQTKNNDNNKAAAIKTKKLKNALKNSNTFENNFLLRPNADSHYGTRKPERKSNERSEEIITSRVIETFLPSITSHEKENKEKPNKSYSYYNSRKTINSKSTEFPPNKHLVTHASVNFLDQYWASQRWMRLNRENNGQHRDAGGSEGDIPSVLNMRSPKYSDQKEKPSSKDSYNYHNSDSGENVGYQNPPNNIDLITSRDLKKLVI